MRGKVKERKQRSSGTSNLQRAVYIAIGMLAAMLTDLWSAHLVLVQMLLFSAMVFAPLLIFLWSSRHCRGLRYGIPVMLIVHCGVLYLARDYFPFRSVFSIVPLAVCEAALFALLGVTLADRQRSDSV